MGGYAWYYTSHNLTPLKAVQQIVDLLQTPYGPLLYILIYTLRPLIFFSAIVLTVTAGAVFGAGSALNFALAVIYTVIGSNISAMLAYLIGRYFGQGLLKEDQGGSTNLMQRYTSRLRRNSFETVMIMRFIFLPYDLVNYLCGFLRINWRSFLLATALGSIPGTIAFVAFGASVDLSQLETQGLPPPNPWVLGFGVVILVVSIAISRYFKRREQQENQDDQEQAHVLNTSIN
ncbi:MAG: TVP38/TMEM64 family protein [Anaerolineales bacterium]|nr:TVP38/TMEM64 family protein [Anaerolineales bacterium]